MDRGCSSELPLLAFFLGSFLRLSLLWPAPLPSSLLTSHDRGQFLVGGIFHTSPSISPPPPPSKDQGQVQAGGCRWCVVRAHPRLDEVGNTGVGIKCGNGCGRCGVQSHPRLDEVGRAGVESGCRILCVKRVWVQNSSSLTISPRPTPSHTIPHFPTLFYTAFSSGVE